MRGPDGHDDGSDQSLVNDDQKSDDQADDQKSDDQKSDDQKSDDKADDQKADDQKADDQKSDDDKSDDAPEPLTRDSLTVPEGFELPEEVGNKLVEILNDSEMSAKDRANALIELHTKTLSDALETDSKAWDDMQGKWRDEAKADPDIGGAKLQPALTNIGKLLDEYGNKDVRGVFDLTGAGNNIHMIKFLSKISEVLTEGGHFLPKSPGGDLTEEQKAQRLYPTMNK